MELSPTDRWQIYEVLVYMAWGDQRLAPEEISAARSVATVLELDDHARSPGPALRRGPRPLAETLDPVRSPLVRQVAYATAAWMAFADLEEHPAERAVLITLRHRLAIDEDTARWLEATALLTTLQGREAGRRAQYRALLHAVRDGDGAFPS